MSSFWRGLRNKVKNYSKIEYILGGQGRLIFYPLWQHSKIPKFIIRLKWKILTSNELWITKPDLTPRWNVIFIRLGTLHMHTAVHILKVMLQWWLQTASLICTDETLFRHTQVIVSTLHPPPKKKRKKKQQQKKVWIKTCLKSVCKSEQKMPMCQYVEMT